MKNIDNRTVKSHVAGTLPPNHPSQPVFAALPDFMDPAEYDAALPFLIRVLRIPPDRGGAP